MNDRGSISPELFAELHVLIAASLAGEISPEQATRLEQLLNDPAARDVYLDLIWESGTLVTWAKSARPTEPAQRLRGDAADRPRRGHIFAFLRRILRIHGDTPLATALMWMVMALCTTGIALTFAFVALLLHGINVRVDQGAVAGGGEHGAGNKEHGADDGLQATRGSRAAKDFPSDVSTVARLTRSVDCRWASRRGAADVGDDLAPGQRLRLESGLAEILFQSGVRTVLQGPATLEIRSRMRASLERGKFSVTVLDPLARGFEVDAPGMKYTDLGTEFAVSVSAGGEQELHVFRGSVRAEEAGSGERAVSEGQGAGSGEQQSPATPRSTLVLVAGQAIHVAAPADAAKLAGPMERIVADNKQFIRRIVTLIDLADIVAGGDGTTGKTGRGIDQMTGRITDTRGLDVPGTREYHRVTAVNFIDGVFVPDGRSGPVQLDSAGHMYALPKTCGRTDYSILAQSTGPLSKIDFGKLEQGRLPEKLLEAVAEPHSRLYLHANVGITFDLQAIRASQPDSQLSRFQAVLSTDRSDNGTAVTAAWIFVDGRLCYSRPALRFTDGCLGIDIPLSADARFLTLVATDADQNLYFDHVLFHCPQLIVGMNESESGQSK